ncbi:MAG TPA: hypothetical protein VKX46_04765 [Ktedonobacteraceae bacterium]|nr:hypothetical protein [Ktedonobacteraceae bacterium]
MGTSLPLEWVKWTWSFVEEIANERREPGQHCRGSRAEPGNLERRQGLSLIAIGYTST